MYAHNKKSKNGNVENTHEEPMKTRTGNEKGEENRVGREPPENK